MVLVSVLGQATEHSEQTNSILRKDFVLGAHFYRKLAGKSDTCFGPCSPHHEIGASYSSICNERMKFNYVLQIIFSGAQ